MSKKTKKVVKKVETTAKGAKASELSEQELGKVAGGASTGGYMKATSR
jgi:hypothetical protein